MPRDRDWKRDRGSESVGHVLRHMNKDNPTERDMLNKNKWTNTEQEKQILKMRKERYRQTCEPEIR